MAMPERVFIPLLLLSIVLGQGISAIGSRYLDCAKVYGDKYCFAYFLDRSGLSNVFNH